MNVLLYITFQQLQILMQWYQVINETYLSISLHSHSILLAGNGYYSLG
jgi:hypothetical protein